MSPHSDPFLQKLEAELGSDAVSTDPVDLQHYGRDWTQLAPPAPIAIAFPRSTEQVAAALRLCAQHNQPVVPSGGRTGLAGGAIAPNGELVISMSRMSRIETVDLAGRTLRVQAGAITQAVHEACAHHGLTWPIDLASKGSSQIGGNLATNAGGTRVIRYGHARHWVMGLQAVDANGSILELGGSVLKDNTGPDLKQLLIGSEGTLAMITEATLKLAPLPTSVAVMLATVDDLNAALRLLSSVREANFALRAFEFFSQRCAERVAQQCGRTPPVQQKSPFYVLIEAEVEPFSEVFESWLAEQLQNAIISDSAIGQSSSQAAELWALREEITASLAAGDRTPHKNDVGSACACASSVLCRTRSHAQRALRVMGALPLRPPGRRKCARQHRAALGH